MFYVKTTGSYYEMGRQLGQANALVIGSMLDYLTTSFRDWNEQKFEEVRARHMRYTEKLFPELVEEIQGIADGSGFSFRWIYLMNFYSAMLAGHQGCSDIIFPRTPEGPLLAKVNDMPAHEGKHGGVRLIKPTGGPALLVGAFHGTCWAEPAINEWGLAGCGASCSTDAPVGDEIMVPHVVMRYLLSRTATVRDAVKLLAEVSIPRWGANFALVDATGDCAIVEKSGSRQGVRREKEGEPMYCTDHHCQTPEMIPFKLDRPVSERSHQARIERIRSFLKQGEPSLELMKKILASTEQPGALCRYAATDEQKYETQSAVIVHVQTRKAEFCFSHADRDPWRTFRMDQ